MCKKVKISWAFFRERKWLDWFNLEGRLCGIEYWANFVCRFNGSRGRHTEEELSHSQLLQKEFFQGNIISTQTKYLSYQRYRRNALLIFIVVRYWLYLVWSFLISGCDCDNLGSMGFTGIGQFSGRTLTDNVDHGRLWTRKALGVSSTSFATHWVNTMVWSTVMECILYQVCFSVTLP